MLWLIRVFYLLVYLCRISLGICFSRMISLVSFDEIEQSYQGIYGLTMEQLRWPLQLPEVLTKGGR